MTEDADLRAEFERCEHWLAEALTYANDTHSTRDIWEGVVNGRFQFWPAERGALITEIQVYPKRNVFHVFLGGGDLDQLTDMIESIEIYARTIGCKSVTVSGRKGWIRVLESRGARELCTTVAKEL